MAARAGPFGRGVEAWIEPPASVAAADPTARQPPPGGARSDTTGVRPQTRWGQLRDGFARHGLVPSMVLATDERLAYQPEKIACEREPKLGV